MCSYRGYEGFDVDIQGIEIIILLKSYFKNLLNMNLDHSLLFSFTVIPSINSFYISKELLNTISFQEDNFQFSGGQKHNFLLYDIHRVASKCLYGDLFWGFYLIKGYTPIPLKISQ